MADAFLRANERQYFFVRVEFNSEAVLIPPGDSEAKFRQSCSLWIAMIGRVTGCLTQLVYDMSWCRHIGVANGKADYILSPVFLLGDLSINFYEQIWR